MPAPEQQPDLRYRAFISYSHAHEVVARKFHRRVEGYRPPKDVVKEDGVCPDQLNPVFRDRDELASAMSLDDELTEALTASEYLVVLCSPEAAASKWVNEEVRVFSAARGAENIRPVIIAGDPPDCFPPALTEVLAEPVAADLRDHKDGFTDGALKAIAGLMGVPFSVLKDREIMRQRRRARINGVIATVFAVLAMFAGVAAWQAVEKTRLAEAELTRAEAAILIAVRGVESIVNQVSEGVHDGSIPTAIADGLLNTAQSMVAGVIALGPDDPRLRRERGALMGQISRHYERVGDTERAKEAADEAKQIFDSLSRDYPDDTYAQVGKVDVLLQQGHLAVAAGSLPTALAAYEKSLAIARDFSARDPGNAGWVRRVSVSLNKVGDIRVAAGDRDGALAAYEESLAIARDLSARDPGNAGWARGVAVSLWSIADLDKENAAERWLLVITQLEAMDERGVLFEEDRQFMDAARENLRASERDSDD